MKSWLVFVAIALSAVAMSSIEVTVGPYKLDGVEYAKSDDCVAAASTALGADARTCTQSIVVRGKCDDVPAPKIPSTTEAVATQCPNNDSRWYTRETGIVDAPYPVCHVLGLVPESPPDICTQAREPGSMEPPAPGDGWVPPVDPAP